MTAPRKSPVAVERAVAMAALAAIGGFAFVESFGYGWFTEGNRVGPGLLPGLTGGLVLLVSLALLAGTFRHPAHREHGLAQVVHASVGDELRDGEPDGAPDVDEPDIFGRTAAQRFRQLQLVSVAVVVALLLVPVLGLLVAMLAFCLFVSIVVERRPWVPSVLVNGVSVAIVWAVFAVALEVPLPGGYLGIGG